MARRDRLMLALAACVPIVVGSSVADAQGAKSGSARSASGPRAQPPSSRAGGGPPRPAAGSSSSPRSVPAGARPPTPAMGSRPSSGPSSAAASKQASGAKRTDSQTKAAAADQGPVAVFPGTNYCGLGQRGGEPRNPTDAACRVHDDDYARLQRENPGAMVHLHPRLTAAADWQLNVALTKLAADRRAAIGERARAAAVLTLFAEFQAARWAYAARPSSLSHTAVEALARRVQDMVAR